MNNTVMTLGDCYNEKAKHEANVKIAYHALSEHDATDPAKFTVKMTHKIVFTSQMPSDEPKAGAFAIKLDEKSWNTNITHMLWQVRWTPKGLTPIKPAVYTLADINILPGRTLNITT
jgi:hypothetical protein